MSERRYGFTPVLAGAMRTIASLPALAGLLGVFRIIRELQNGHLTDLQLGIMGLSVLGLVVVGLILFGMAELLYIAMDVEENTRRSAEDRAMELARDRDGSDPSYLLQAADAR